jgi:hypothetical protein
MNLLIRILGGLRLAIMPATSGFILGLTVYVLFPGETGLLAAFIITLAGLLGGLVLATIAFLRKGDS